MVDTLKFITSKYKIKIGRQHIIEIPNIGRNQLAQLFAELEFTKGAEIGVEKGIYSEILLKANPDLKLFSIDPWKASAYVAGIQGVDYRQKHFDECYKEAKNRLREYDGCTIVRKTSLDAAERFKDASLDFVYIDGNHDFVNVTNDINVWQKKVRPGGIVAGHDYAFFPGGKRNHVKHVILAYTKAYGIIPLFIAGAEAVGQRGIIRDRFRSWFWVKNEQNT